MLKKIPSWQNSSGQTFATLEDAQASELALLINPNPADIPEDLLKRIVGEKAKVIDILTTTDSSRPKARKINGATKNRKPAPTVAPAQPQAA